MKYKLYIKKLFLIISIFGSIIFLFNYIVDPYGISNKIRIKGFNFFKPAYHLNTREWKVYNSLDVNPDILFFGGSTMEYLKPEVSFLEVNNKIKPFNLALSSVTSFETLHYLKFATNNFDINKIYYGIDFYSLLDTGKISSGSFDKEFLSSNYIILKLKYYQKFFSFDAIEKSINTIQLNIRDREGKTIGRHYNKYGSRTNTWKNYALKTYGNKWLENEFKHTVKHQFNKVYKNVSKNAITLKKSYIKVLELSKYNNIDIFTYTPPFYAKFYIKLINSRMYPIYKDYLLFLAKNGGFYHFQANNSITKNKNLFWDSIHARKEMSDELFSNIDNNICKKDFFGCFIDKDNIDKLINYIENERQ
jgi:hypothetical protein